MKKDESPKATIPKDRRIMKNDNKIQGQKYQSAKPFLGCDTCKLKHSASSRKGRSVQETQEKIKIKKSVESNQNVDKPKIKLTDLCDEDKKRIVELMEEVAKFAEKNRYLKESLEFSEKAKQDHQDCLMKQTNLHLEEKNLFLKEIQAHKSKLELYEAEMKEKIRKWEEREQFLDGEIRYLAKALHKSLNDKTELMKEMNHLKTCLKQSLESFELLRNEVVSLQRLPPKPEKINSTSRSSIGSGERVSIEKRAEKPEDELLSIPSIKKENHSNKSSLDIINNKLEQLYALLQIKSGTTEKTASIPENIPEPEPTNVETGSTRGGNDQEQAKSQNILNRSIEKQEGDEVKTTDSNYMFLKPFNKCSKTSIQAERILKQIEKSFCVDYEERSGNNGDKGVKALEKNISGEVYAYQDMTEGCSSLDEDQILNELFYSDTNVDLRVESLLLGAHKKLYSTDVF